MLGKIQTLFRFHSGGYWWRNKDAYHNAGRIKSKRFLGYTLSYPICILAKCWTVSSFFKKYTAVAELGKATDSLDVTGNVVEEKNFGEHRNLCRHHDRGMEISQKLVFKNLCLESLLCFSDHITKETLEEKLKDYTGEIMQVPPLWVWPLHWIYTHFIPVKKHFLYDRNVWFLHLKILSAEKGWQAHVCPAEARSGGRG